jgi:hypothetical protein
MAAAKRLGIGVIGIGWVAREHIKAWKNNPHCAVVALASHSVANALLDRGSLNHPLSPISTWPPTNWSSVVTGAPSGSYRLGGWIGEALASYLGLGRSLPPRLAATSQGGDAPLYSINTSFSSGGQS